MSQIVVDTGVASYIFNWHSQAQQYAGALRGSELILSFMTIAELRMGAIALVRRLGRSMSPQDAWVAATALGLDAMLATNNRRDFEHVRKLRLVSL